MTTIRTRAVPYRRPIAASRRALRPHLEPLELRLALSWTGIPPLTISPPTSAPSVTLNSQGDATGNASITSNETDYSTFVAPVGGSYRISVTTPNSNLDTVLGVFSASGTRVAYNDNISFGNHDSQLTRTLAAGSRYYIGITNYTGSPGGSYTWLVDGPVVSIADDGYEQNDSLSQAWNLGSITNPRTISNLVLADQDWFRFTTSTTGTSANSVSITFQNALGNLGLELYNGTGQVLRASNTANNGEVVSLSGLAAGTYYVRVFGTSGATNPNYTLTITPPPPSNGSTGGFDIVVSYAGLTASQQQVFGQAASRWEQIIVGDLPNATYQGITVDDILIDASSVPIDGVGGVLGQAGPDYIRGSSALPIHGIMQFDTADLASLESSGILLPVILHEMGHVLGIGTIWQILGLLSGAGTSNPQFLGPRATAEYNALSGANAIGVPVEGFPAPVGTRDAHWRESIFGNELMTGYIGGATNPISRVTVASLADIGYTVSMAAADAYTLPSQSRLFSIATATSRGRNSLVGAGALDWLSPPTRCPLSPRTASHGPGYSTFAIA